jgi:hypothetical protein
MYVYEINASMGYASQEASYDPAFIASHPFLVPKIRKMKSFSVLFALCFHHALG